MRKQMVFVLIAVCAGLFLTWSAVQATATQEFLANSPSELINQAVAGAGILNNPITSQARDEKMSTEDLLVYVVTAEGLPAVNAMVEASTLTGFAYDFGYTDQNGYVTLSLPAGNYTVIASSTSDHFYLSKYPVTFPGNITISAMGTPVVTLTAKLRNGSAMEQGKVGINVTGGFANRWMYGELGNVGPSGVMIFNVSPGIYDIEVIDEVNYYFVFTADQDFHTSGIVNFDMSTLPSGELVAAHPEDSLSLLYACTSENNLACPALDNLVDGTRLIVSTDIGYRFSQEITREDMGGDYWHYQFYLENMEYTAFAPGEVITFTAGGELSVIGRTAEAVVGDYIHLADVKNSEGSYLTYIYTDTADPADYTAILPDITLFKPDGTTEQLNSTWYLLPDDSPTGIYQLQFNWNTGDPYLGVISGESQFRVLPQQVSTTIGLEGGQLYSAWDDTLYEFAAGTFTEPVVITHTVVYRNIPESDPLLGIGHFYTMDAIYASSGETAQPSQPYSITVGYTEKQRGVVIENSLALYEWDGAQWLQDLTTGIDPINNHVTATPNHFSTWGILGETNRVFITLISRN